MSKENVAIKAKVVEEATERFKNAQSAIVVDQCG